MYIIQELQVSNEGQAAFLPPVVKEDPYAAESEFYIKTGYAAISSIWRHTVVLYTDAGSLFKFKCYQHDANGTAVLNDTDIPLDGG